MASLWQTAVTAVGLFASTNIDDIVVLSVLSASCVATGRPSRRQIWVGQYLGMTALVLFSVLASRGLTLIRPDWVSLLGLIPLSLGVYRLATAMRAQRSDEPSAATGIAGVAALTIANGGDNVAAYTPIFGTQSGAETWLTIAVFAACVAAWCALGAVLVTHRRVVLALHAWGHWIVPVVYIAIGLWVLHK
ncbi:cadmium resistance protein CadD (predicted permease) [Mycobacterium sp. MAA66]|uniref:cadmium resistance transporter n=1 Tax=Mycobacterium sp. MAA66 TaxID=3156297 RepID=UPI003517D81D